MIKKILHKINVWVISVKDTLRDGDEPHWTVDWDKAEYRILKRWNDAGTNTFRAQRKLHNEWENLIGNTFACHTEQDARFLIEKDKRFYQENFLIEHSHQTEIILVA